MRWRENNRSVSGHLNDRITVLFYIGPRYDSKHLIEAKTSQPDPLHPSLRLDQAGRGRTHTCVEVQMISTRDLSLLPDINGPSPRPPVDGNVGFHSLPRLQYRYYSFNSAWAAGEQMGSMRTERDDFFAHFSSRGCWLKGFAHEYPMTPYLEKPKRSGRNIRCRAT